ncbi:MAG: methionyl-tRNA formyltransferase [Candidatus Taylorbacteria bacterium]
MNTLSIKFIFFGTPRRGAKILEILKGGGLIPSLIVTAPDMPKGRGLKLSPSEVKQWAIENEIPFLQPSNLEDASFRESISKKKYQLGVVVSYGKMMPNWLLDLPQNGSLNLHFSLLPKYRGAIPAEAAILNGDTETGVSVVLMDEKLDHGPIVGLTTYPMPDPLPTSFELVEALSLIGGKLLLEVIPDFVAGKIQPREQEHVNASYTKKIRKEDGLIDLGENPLTNWRKIQAYREWPKPYFFSQKKGQQIRVIIRDAKFENGKLEILKVTPEGRKEISYSDWKKQSPL